MSGSPRNERRPPKAHYRDRHVSLEELPQLSTWHGFECRMGKISDEDLQRLARQPPAYGVLSFGDSAVATQSPATTTRERRSSTKKSGNKSSASTKLSAPPAQNRHLQVQTAMWAPTTGHTAANTSSSQAMQYDPVSPSNYSDNTPVSATDSHNYPFSNVYGLNAPGSFPAFGGGVQGMGFHAAPPQHAHEVTTFDFGFSLESPSGDQSGLMAGNGYPPHFSYDIDANTMPNNDAFYHYGSGAAVYSGADTQTGFNQAQFMQPGGHVVAATNNLNYAGDFGNYTHGNGQNYYYPPSNFGQ